MRKTRKEEQIMLKIENLHKIYGKYHALSGLNMTVREGALYGFVGPNGAGKWDSEQHSVTTYKLPL